MRNTFLGPFGAATVVLFTSQFDTQLPKLGEMKKRLGVTDGKYYSGHGNFEQPVRFLENAIATARNAGHPSGKPYPSVHCSHILLTVADVHSDLFALIRFSAELLGGFNLNEHAMEELSRLLDRRQEITWMRMACTGWAEQLTDHKAKARRLKLTDPSILNADVEAISTVTKPYALGALAEVDEEITLWYERYRWRTVQEAHALAAEADVQLIANSVTANSNEQTELT
jgi:hypothetical protein